MSIQSPEFDIRRDEKGIFNAQSSSVRERQGKAEPKKQGRPRHPYLSTSTRYSCQGGKISFSDLSGSKPFKTILDPIDLKVDHFSNGKDKKSAYALSLKTEAKETVKVEGEFSMDPSGSKARWRSHPFL